MSKEPSSSAEFVRWNTELLREGDDPLWQRLRTLLAERGVDWARCLLANSWPEDSNIELCFLVTPDHTVIEFEFEYGSRGDLKRQAAEGIISAWRSMTGDQIRNSPAGGEIEAALHMLAQNG